MIKKKKLSNLFEKRMFQMQQIHFFDENIFLKDFSLLYQNEIQNISTSKFITTTTSTYALHRDVYMVF